MFVQQLITWWTSETMLANTDQKARIQLIKDLEKGRMALVAGAVMLVAAGIISQSFIVLTLTGFLALLAHDVYQILGASKETLKIEDPDAKKASMMALAEKTFFMSIIFENAKQVEINTKE